MIDGGGNTAWMTIIFGTPAVISFIYALVVALHSLTTSGVRRKLGRILVLALMMQVCAWGCMILYIQWPVLFVVFQGLFFYSFLVWHALLYYFIRLVTNTGQQEHFSRWHFIVPAIIPAALIIWSLFVPMEAQVYIVETRGKAMPGYETYTALFTSKAPLLAAWNIVYTLLSLKRVTAFRRKFSDYSADEGRSPIQWLKLLIGLMLSAIMLPLIALVLGKAVFAGSVMMMIPAMLIPVAIGVLSYNIVAENYVVFDDTAENNGVDDSKDNDKGSDMSDNGRRRLNRERFEHYIRTRKPYLNPRLRIMDMAAELNTNRTYLSNFINAEYGMNFSRYVNRLRLTELDRLRIDPALAGKSGLDMVLMSGFSSYKGYIRVKTEEDKLKTIKVFE